MPTSLATSSHPPLRSRPGRGPKTGFNLTCVAIGMAAVGLAIFVDYFCHDRTGAVLILLMTGGLNALLLRSASRAADDLDNEPP